MILLPSVKPGRRMNKKCKEELTKETTDFFRNSMDFAIKYNIPIILPSGTRFKTENNETADDSWPIFRIGLTEIGQETDAMVAQAIKTKNSKVIQLLYGKIYGNGGLFRFMYYMMANGRSMIIGKGGNFIPNVHAGDAASAIVKAIEKLPIGEKFIIADDTPVTQKEFTCYMAKLMNKKQPGHIPAFIIKLVLGNDFYQVIRLNCKVSNSKAKNILGWEPQYPSYKEGLQKTIKEIKENKNSPFII